MATPLAVALFLLTAWAGAESRSAEAQAPVEGRAAASPRGECPVPLFEPAEKKFAVLDAGTRTCADALRMLPDFERLRAKAGFGPDDFYLILSRDERDNASFAPVASAFGLVVNTGFLIRDPDRSRILYMLAHEIGHGLQWGRTEGEQWRALRAAVGKRLNTSVHEEIDADPEWQAFSRRYEAQADGIAVQLLVEAGYPADANRQGQESFFGCRNEELPSAHPAPRQRVLNSNFGQELIARHATEGMDAAAFDGARKRQGGVAAPDRALGPAPARRFMPVARLEDYDPQGRLLPGRLASADLRIPVPPPHAGPVHSFLQHAAASIVDRWIADPFAAAVNRLVLDQQAAEAVLAACGTPEAAELSRRMSVWGWMREIAERGATGTATLLQSP